jgi:hypothetical protein
MFNSTCTAQDIFELNKTKEYLLTASCLLERVTTDPNLNAQAAMLWQILFNKAKFTRKLEVQITYSYLAKMLGKSTRTIQRHVKTLANNNYLVIKNNYLDNGGQIANTILVRFPADKIQDAKQTKDRIKPHFENEKIPSNQESSYKQTLNDIPQDKEKVVSNVKKCLGSSVFHVEHKKTHKNDDKSDIVEGDKNVVQNNNINKINKNIKNNIPNKSIGKQQKDQSDVVPSTKFTDKNKPTQISSTEELHQEISELKNEFKAKQKTQVRLKQLIAIATKEELDAYQNKTQLPYEKMQANNQLRTDFDICEMKLEYLQKNINEKEKLLKNQKTIEEDISYMTTKEGPRPISPFTFKRLNKSLENLGYQDIDKIKLINEIIYEARFGSLINTNTTLTEMPIERSINIALKLVRENRWCTPTILRY